MEKSEKKLRETVAGLFADKKIEVFIGFERGSVKGLARPVIIRSGEDVSRLVWDNTCANNLAVYLSDVYRRKRLRPGQEPPPPPKAGIVVKGCDALAVAGLVREHQVPRESLVVIGMPCAGITDDATGEVLPACWACRTPTAEGADILIEGPSIKTGKERFKQVSEFAAKSTEERWAYFKEQMDKCIRCYACRQACPNCYCTECFAEQTSPRWIGVSSEITDTMIYHLGRLFHQVGRCTSCGACARACPMGVDLRPFTEKLVLDAKELFDFEIGFSSEEQPMLNTFKDGDYNEFITDPDKKKG